METLFMVVGAGCIFMLSLAMCASVCALLVHVAGEVYDKWRFDIIYRRDKELGEILKSGAHYMSEDPKIESLLRFLGGQIQGGYSVYAGHWRELWEHVRKEAK